MQIPLVSVVIPTYDRPALLTRAIESVTAQTYSPTELVVVDDHSPAPDAARETVAAADTDGLHAVAFVREDENRGVSASRNTGIEHANGEYIAFLAAAELGESWYRHGQTLKRTLSG